MSTSPDERRSSEIRGLDTVLRGGFLCRRSYLVSGAPGTGKTILGLHFLDRGLQLEERPLLITFSEPAASLERNLGNLGFSFDRIKVLDLTPPVKLFSDAETVSELEPQRVLVDGSLTLTQKTRKASVSKFRGSGFAGGEHTLRIGDKGIPMFPTLTVRRDVPKRGTVQIPFSIESLDQKLHGGIEPGTVTLLTAPPGRGENHSRLAVHA
jgi:KaiC/GvpD/RAD55 family RecA-like ATPase